MIRKLMKIRDVAEATGRSRSTIYELMKEGNFPQPVKVGAKSVRWVEDEIAEFNEHLIALRDSEQGEAL
jgi:prophage regulatory protein